MELALKCFLLFSQKSEFSEQWRRDVNMKMKSGSSSFVRSFVFFRPTENFWIKPEKQFRKQEKSTCQWLFVNNNTFLFVAFNPFFFLFFFSIFSFQTSIFNFLPLLNFYIISFVFVFLILLLFSLCVLFTFKLAAGIRVERREGKLIFFFFDNC